MSHRALTNLILFDALNLSTKKMSKKCHQVRMIDMYLGIYDCCTKKETFCKSYHSERIRQKLIYDIPADQKYVAIINTSFFH